MNAIPRLRSYRGPALLSYGFRPFFLFGAIYAGLIMLAWLPMFYGELALWTTFTPIDWHVHETLYGFLPAVVTGFLLTAIPNWTGRLPIQGMPLLALVAVWVAGRVAVTFSTGVGWRPRLLTSAFLSWSSRRSRARSLPAVIGEISRSWAWSHYCSPAISRFMSRRIFMAAPNTAFASVSPSWCCSSR